MVRYAVRSQPPCRWLPEQGEPLGPLLANGWGGDAGGSFLLPHKLWYNARDPDGPWILAGTLGEKRLW